MNLVRFGLALLLAASSVMGQARQLGPKDGFDLRPADLERVRVGMPAPDFTLESKDGDLVTLSSFRGHTNIVLVFYRGYW
jgi:cytochrome oxidase Cu insertion factor (SCO1/SenC/PrrC family)